MDGEPQEGISARQYLNDSLGQQFPVLAGSRVARPAGMTIVRRVLLTLGAAAAVLGVGLWRRHSSSKSIQVGYVSEGWLQEQRREAE